MGSSVRCFLVQPTDREKRALRRFVFSSEAKPCPGRYGYHNAVAPWLEDAPVNRDENGYYGSPPKEEWPASDDPRWPTHCECGYAFEPEDQWQIFHDTIYTRPETGERWPHRELPPGAMWENWWWPDKGPDGKCLSVMLPNGVDWMIDGPSRNDKRPWTRTGTPPVITAMPSILVERSSTWKRYHGFLTDGVLVATGDSEC
jgi:hypothetical protein